MDIEREMSLSCSTELLAEAAGVKIIMTTSNEQSEDRSTERIVLVFNNEDGSTDVQNKSCGFHLTKSKWDPYPWVGYVEPGSIADLAGLRPGDCILNVDNTDLVGLKVKDIAVLIRGNGHKHKVHLNVWRSTERTDDEEVGLALKGPLPDVATKLANVVSGTVRVLECPVCLENAAPPVSQCVHGHIICVDCRPKTARCPVCRVRLGQGRCLLADKIHRVLSNAFEVKEENKNYDERGSWRLRERLFGKKRSSQKAVKSNGSTASKPRQLLLARLLLSGLGKAASAENLTTVSDVPKESAINHESIQLDGNLSERLSLYDRTKSASTGELSMEKTNGITSEHLRTVQPGSEMSSTATSLSLPETPAWGGSVDSVANVQIACPFSIKHTCSVLTTCHNLVEHLKSHTAVQIHFHRDSATIPLSSPFGPQVIYLLHHGEEIFFFQHDEESAWMVSATANNYWGWTLHGRGDDGTQVKLYRMVGSLEDPITLASKHIAPLPQELALHTAEVSLLENQSKDRLNI